MCRSDTEVTPKRAPAEPIYLLGRAARRRAGGGGSWVSLGCSSKRAVHAFQVFPSESAARRIPLRVGASWLGSCAIVCALGHDARGESSDLGAGWRASPGYFRVPVVAAVAPGALLMGGVAYGFTESQAAAPGRHHRVQGRLAGGVTLLRGLDLSAGTNLRYDRHEADGLGADQGTVLDSDLHAEVGSELWPELHLGLGVGAAFTRGEGLGRSLQNPALDAHLLAAYLPRGAPLSLGVLVGFRLDRTAGVVRDPARYRSGDRLALEVSAFDAVPLGIGTNYRLGQTELLLELSGDVLVGSGAPDFLRSPLRATAGARQKLSDELSFRVLTDTSLSKRSDTSAAEAPLPVEPRFAVLVGMSYQWLGTAPKPEPLPPPSLRRPVAAPLLASLRVNVTTREGYPLSDATVELLVSAQTIAVPHDNLQLYRLDEIRVHEAMLRVRAARLEAYEAKVAFVAGAPLVVDVQLQPAPPSGQVRGLVRSFSGTALHAKIRIEPPGTELYTDAVGAFSADVPPGHYDILVEAPGHQAQRRRVEVAADGVVILNADLSKGQP